MNFISLEFVFFYPAVLFLYWIFPGKFRWILLLTVSCYRKGDPGFKKTAGTGGKKMNFISLEFVFFYPAVLFLYWIFPGKYRWILLLTVSCIFYFSESSWAGILLLITTAVTYFAARNIQNEKLYAAGF